MPSCGFQGLAQGSSYCYKVLFLPTVYESNFHMQQNGSNNLGLSCAKLSSAEASYTLANGLLAYAVV